MQNFSSIRYRQATSHARVHPSSVFVPELQQYPIDDAWFSPWQAFLITPVAR
jgi:hypothetical protein